MIDDSKRSFLNTVYQCITKFTSKESASFTTSTDVQHMNEDNEKWSTEHLQTLSVTSTETSNTLQVNSTKVSETVANTSIERMKLCISKIKDNQINEEQKKEFLIELCHWAEELHSAEDFFTLGGLDILSKLLDENNDSIRAQTCSLIVNLVQSNHHCQRIIVQSGLKEKLLKIFDESNNPDLKTKAVTAISGMNKYNTKRNEVNLENEQKTST
ncbi:unnamed protein product [Rotaria sp. Silwood2]|nr:unnamed protein product [Rotaria sp. Silwood2]CAF4348307.1 unnamed protein product [Rotaria sp. Silwood2]